MNPNAQAKSIVLVLLALAIAASPGLHAQEEAAAEEKETEAGLLGPIQLEVQAWVAQPAGLQYESATLSDPTNPFNTGTFDAGYGTHNALRYRLVYGLPKNIGELSLTYYKNEDSTEIRRLDPGNFVFGELLTPTPFSGYLNDGLADGFIASTATTLTDWHFDFSRQAFHSTFVNGKWSVGWRRVEHNREQNASYYAMLPGSSVLLPPLCNACPNLDPQPDTASLGSKYSGRGPSLGIELDFPLWHDKLVLEGGAALGVLRGKAQTSYVSRTSTYLFQADPLQFTFLDPPYSETGLYWNDTQNVLCPSINFDTSLPDGDCDVDDALIPAAARVSQAPSVLGLQGQSIAMSSQVLEAYIGFRWKVLSWLEVNGGFRSTRYDNVGVDIRPRSSTVKLTTINGQAVLQTNSQDADQTEHSVTYEGFYAGLTFHLHK